jgi:HD-GYP domain-containing protein (c-di-GMP phosphodiesterase class II)
MEKQPVFSKNNPKIYLPEVKKILAGEKDYFNMIHKKLAGIMDDFGETLRHCQRVSNLCWLLANFFGWIEERTSLFVEAGDSHDIGKIAVPKEALHSKHFGPEERDIITRHPRVGYLLILNWGSERKRERDRFWKVAKAILLHHEFQGGRSYHILKRAEIKDFSSEDFRHGKLLSMADVFDTYVFGRPLTGIMPIPIDETRKRLAAQFKDAGDEEIIEFLFAQYPLIKKHSDAASPR